MFEASASSVPLSPSSASFTVPSPANLPLPEIGSDLNILNVSTLL